MSSASRTSSIDRLNAFKHGKSEVDGERVELLIRRYIADLDWPYLEKRARALENDTLKELLTFKQKAER
ncbi:MAG: hypothetical protein N3G78_12855 [Desulfobacterota bacterium]|nr:hypothetical protein [Thermodesulfobacteriota bacterium]